jgi:hypothetical protein
MCRQLCTREDGSEIGHDWRCSASTGLGEVALRCYGALWAGVALQEAETVPPWWCGSQAISWALRLTRGLLSSSRHIGLNRHSRNRCRGMTEPVAAKACCLDGLTRTQCRNTAKPQHSPVFLLTAWQAIYGSGTLESETPLDTRPSPRCSGHDLGIEAVGRSDRDLEHYTLESMAQVEVLRSQSAMKMSGTS